MEFVRFLNAIRPAGLFYRIISYLKSRTSTAYLLTGLVCFSLFLPAFRIVRMDKEKSIFEFTRNSDFEDYYNASVNLSRGEDLYHLENLKNAGRNYDIKDLTDPARLTEFLKEIREVGTYLYPPLTAFLLLPLSGLSYPSAAAVYQILSIAALLLFLFHLRIKTAANGEFYFIVPLLISLFFLYNFFLGNFLNGNILTFLILLTGSGILFSFSEEKKISFLGGFLIGFAVLIKVTPVFFGLVLFSKRRYAAVAGAAAGAIAGVLLPAVYLGFSENLNLFSAWLSVIPRTYGEVGIVRPWANNQSVSAMIGKLFIPGSDAKQAQAGLPLFYSGGAFSSGQVRFFAAIVKSFNLMLVLSASAAGLFLFFKNKKKEHRRFDREAVYLIFSAVLLSLLVSGVSWYHAYGMLFFPVFYRLNLYLKGDPFASAEKAGFAVIIVFGLIYNFFPGQLKDILSLYSVFTMAAIVMFASSLVYLARKKYGI